MPPVPGDKKGGNPNSDDDKQKPPNGKVDQPDKPKTTKDALFSSGSHNGKKSEHVTVQLASGEEIQVEKLQLDFKATELSELKSDELTGVTVDSDPTSATKPFKPTPVYRDIYKDIVPEVDVTSDESVNGSPGKAEKAKKAATEDKTSPVSSTKKSEEAAKTTVKQSPNDGKNLNSEGKSKSDAKALADAAQTKTEAPKVSANHGKEAKSHASKSQEVNGNGHRKSDAIAAPLSEDSKSKTSSDGQSSNGNPVDLKVPKQVSNSKQKPKGESSGVKAVNGVPQKVNETRMDSKEAEVHAKNGGEQIETQKSTKTNKPEIVKEIKKPQESKASLNVKNTNGKVVKESETNNSKLKVVDSEDSSANNKSPKETLDVKKAEAENSSKGDENMEDKRKEASDSKEEEKEGKPKRSVALTAQRLLSLCKKGDWLAVDTVLKHCDLSTLDFSETAEPIGWTPVMYAAQDNRVNIIEKLLDIGYNVNAKATDGVTALHLACAHAREDTIRLLLVRKADPLACGGPKNQLPIHVISGKPTGAAVIPLQLILRSSPKEIRLIVDGDGNTPLLLAVEVGNHGVVRELLFSLPKEQFQIKKAETEESVVHIATKRRDMDMLRLLVDAGADVNMQNSDGQTPLHIVARDGDDVFLRFFYAAGANPDIPDDEERTPIHLATANGHTRVVDILTEKFKADVFGRTKDGSTLMHIASKAGHAETAMSFMRKGVPLHMTDKRGAKAIHLAALAGQMDVIRQVLQRGERIDVRTNEGLTALHVAVGANQWRVVEALLGHGASASVKAGKTEETPLHVAAKTPGGRTSASLLLKSGADPNAVESHLETPLHFAGRYGHLDCLMLLLGEDGNPAMQNDAGENVLHVITKECHFEVMQQVLHYISKHSSNEQATKLVNAQNKRGESSVHYAASLDSKKTHFPNEDRDIMRLLLHFNGDVTLGTTETSETAIHFCSKSGNTNVLNEILGQLQPLDAQVACNHQAKNGFSPLLYACYYGHPKVIELLIQHNARVDVFDERGRAGLHLAAELGHQDVCTILLENNAFVNVRNKNGLTPLHLASRMGFNDLVNTLVSKYGALLDAQSLTKQTPLHLASEHGQLEVCKTLLELKADINAVDNQSQTPLHLAAQSDHPEVLKLFLKHKPELVSVANKNGYTCAHIAAIKGSVAVLKELMKFNKEAVKSARIKKTGSTALHLAAEGGHVKAVRLLLQAGAKASDENLEGNTPLHLAAKQGHIRVLHALKGALDWKLCSRKNGLSAIHVAASCGQTDFISEMLTQVPATLKSERSLKDPSGDYGITPLHLAAQNGHEGAVRLLMNSPGVQVDAPTQVHGTIPLHLAAQGGHMLVAGLLINRSADSLSKTDKQGRTCVHLAAAHGHHAMCGLLLGQGAEINAQDKKGWTPLHHAARHGYLEVVKLLTDSGADPTATTKDEKVPLCCAAGAGHYEVLSYLLKKEHDSVQLMEDKVFLLDLMTCSKNHENKPIQEFILVSEAPIDTAVKLASHFEVLATKEKERARDLEAACQYADQVAIDLLCIAATTNNAGALLRSYDHKNSEFLDVLIELDRKDVVSQHAVQKYLTDVWIGGLKWSGFRFILLFFSFLMIPPIWIFFSTPIGHKFHRIPIIKFMSYLTSHIFFIAILTYTTVFPSVPLYEYEWYPLWNEVVLLIWLIGILVSDLTNPTERHGLGIIKTVILIVGFAGVFVHILTFMLDVVINGNFNWTLDSTDRLDMLYGRNQLFAVCMLLSFVDFLNFLTFHPLFGPWGVIIQELIRDLLLFLSILSLFMAGFTLHICAVYHPVYAHPDYFNRTLPTLGQELIEPGKSFEMLFFAIFGLVEPDNMPPMHLSPAWAKTIMKVVFGVYMMVTVVVLVNLLIAMMSNTYQRIEAQSDIEWKFGRAKLIRNMNRTLSTPSPINLFIGLPVKGGEKVVKFCGRKKEKEIKFAKQAFGHLADQRPEAIAAKQWLNRRASRVSRVSRMTYATMHTSMYGVEAGMEECKPISEVVNWDLIVQKYYESYGIFNQASDEEVMEEDDASAV